MLIAAAVLRLLNATHQSPNFYFFAAFGNRNFHSWPLLRREAVYAGAGMLSCQLLKLGEIWVGRRGKRAGDTIKELLGIQRFGQGTARNG